METALLALELEEYLGLAGIGRVLGVAHSSISCWTDSAEIVGGLFAGRLVVTYTGLFCTEIAGSWLLSSTLAGLKAAPS